ncbi:hypothetical protein ACFL1N_14875 [Thermodesulfobacteriota bacterium]
MGKVIHFSEHPDKIQNGLITLSPWEFRKPEWPSKFFTQTLKKDFREFREKGETMNTFPPGHLLKDSLSDTIHSVFRYKDNPENMKEVYYLTGLIDCIINQTNPLLRTGSIGEMYKKIKTFKEILGVNWYGRMDNILLPIDENLFNLDEYRAGLSGAETMKELYSFIRRGTEEMFNILAAEYVFFLPGDGVS